MGCCWSVNPVTGTICRLLKDGWQGREVASYWQREVEGERAGVAGNESLFQFMCTAECCCWWIPEERRRILVNAASAKSWLEFIIKHQGIKNCEMGSCFTDTLEYMWNMMNSKQFFRDAAITKGVFLFLTCVCLTRGRRAVHIHCSSQEVTMQPGMWLLHITVYKTDYRAIQLHANSIRKLTH